MFRKYFTSNSVYVVTNGLLLLKMPEKFWECCRDNRIIIKQTKYPVKLDFDAIEQKCKNEKVAFMYYGKTGEIEKEMYCQPMDINGKQNYKKSFYLCHMPNTICTKLENGKIYPCSVITNIQHFNNYFNKNLTVESGDYIDIYKAKTTDEILTFLTKPKPFCRHCKISETRRGIKWGVSKKDISEWT